MTNECNFQMKKMKQHIEKLKEKKNLENKIKEINDKYNTQVKSFTSDFETMRKEVKEKHKKFKLMKMKIYQKRMKSLIILEKT